VSAPADKWRIGGYDAGRLDAWDRVVAQARNGTFLHSRAFLDYHAWRFDEVSRMVYRHGKAVAVFPANRQGNCAVSHGGLTFGGLLYIQDVHAAEVLEIFGALAASLRADGIESVWYKGVPHLFQRAPAEDDLYALFRQGARLARRDLSCALDLQNRPALSELRRRTLRKAEKQALSLREGLFFAAFHQLLTEVLARHGATPVHDLAELALLQSRFPQQIRLFGIWQEQTLLAASWVFDFGQTVHTQYLACAPQGMALGALDLLLDRLMNQVFCDKRWLSFGISSESDGRVLNEGLMLYKEGFGARALCNDVYQWDLP